MDISLRDYLAGQALAGMLASEIAEPYQLLNNPENAADQAYLHADAMLERRKTPPPAKP